MIVSRNHPCCSNARAAVTLLELLIATGVMTVLVAALGAMADAVYQASEYSSGYGTATQHARVVIDRIKEHVEQATASEEFPGVIVLAETIGSWRFPDRLVVWHPDGAAADPDGRPLMNEVIVYCADPSAPNQLLEVTAPDDTSLAPAADDATAWQNTIDTLLAGDTAERIMLTDLLRTANVSDLSDSDSRRRRAAIRFEVELRPSAADWANYDDGNGSLAWEDIPWAQSIYGSQTGLRQIWLRYELQMEPGVTVSTSPEEALPALPFLGSAALYDQLRKPE